MLYYKTKAQRNSSFFDIDRQGIRGGGGSGGGGGGLWQGIGKQFNCRLPQHFTSHCDCLPTSST